MNLAFSRDDEAFREQVRSFFEDSISDDLRTRVSAGGEEGFDREAGTEFQTLLAEKGWAVPKWPVEAGGPGWSPTQRYIYDEELVRAGLPQTGGFGITMLGPILFTYGNDEQKKRWLDDIIYNRTIWCQGYSERGAGSDLAGLQLSAKLEGDNYIVNGHKIWTSGADMADWIFCLTRTWGEGKKQEGITFLLFDMKSPGIEVRPIRLISGEFTVNEVFFDNVKVPADQRIGEEGKGWTYAKVLLQNERTGIAGVAGSKQSMQRLRRIVSEEPDGEGGALKENADFKTRMDLIDLELEGLNYTELQSLAEAAAGKFPGPGSSYLKVKGTELQQAISELYVEASAYYAHTSSNLMSEFGSNVGTIGPDWTPAVTQDYMGGRAATIYGGSNEINRNVIAKAVLGL